MTCPISKEDRAILAALANGQSQSHKAGPSQPWPAGVNGEQTQTINGVPATHDATWATEAGELVENAPLTAPERVIVRDIWNKFLAFQDMLVEMFFERLVYEEPQLIDCFGDAIDMVPGYFAQLFDLSIRQLNPRTEQVLRESYRGIYPASAQDTGNTDEYTTLLADLGMRPEHWLSARRVWMWVLSEVPYLEDYDREDLAKGVNSAMYRFFTLVVLPKGLAPIERYDETLTPDVISQMKQDCEVIATDALGAGTDFYRILFHAHPEIVPFFGRVDMDVLAGHLMQTISFLIRSLESGRNVVHEVRELSRVHTNLRIPPDAYGKITGPLICVLRQRVAGLTPQRERAWSMLLARVGNVLKLPMVNHQQILGEANEFLRMVATELAWEPAVLERRLLEVEREIYATGTYTHTTDELTYGAQVAWRNSAKCIGRIAWRNMIVRDLRHVTDPDAMFRECVEHMRMATNGGNIQIVMSVFRAKKPAERWGPRIWNSQYIRFAAYEQPDGTILGDKANLKLTRALLRLGWTPPAHKTASDCLPLVIDVPGHPPKLYEFAPEDLLTVPIEHPSYPGFRELNMRWCAVPAITNFRMAIGGVQYGCLPFNGWFMETEIARNLWEEWRYDKAEAIARVMGLDTSSEQTLWRDRTFLELNAAVLYSFSKAKVTLVDHQTAARQFLIHDQREKRAGRECPAQWSWVVPSAGGSATPVWHHEMRDFYLNPSYHYAADKWAVVDAEGVIMGEQTQTETTDSARVLILYGSETGTAESYARQTARRLSRHQPRVMALDEYDVSKLAQEQWLLVVTSTFSNGELPGNAQQFYASLCAQPAGSLDQLNYAVMALGSTVYPHFCAGGVMLDRELARVGARRAVAIHKGDEIRGQADTFRQWLTIVARLLGEDSAWADQAQTNDVQLNVSFLNPRQLSAVATDGRRRQQPGVEVPVVANRELLKQVIAGSRSTRFIAFDISGANITYETGDHVAIYPRNPAALVQRLCWRLGVATESWFTAELVTSDGISVVGEHAYAEPVRVGDVLTDDVDLSLREPVDELIATLLASTTTDESRNRLSLWASTLALGDDNEACRLLKKYLADQFMTVVDLLDAFPDIPITFAQLIELLPKQKPRLYSISSCSLVHPTQIHVTVGVVQVKTDAGKTRPGLCSNYLAWLDPAQNPTVRIAVRTSTFRPPQDPYAPVLMVGPGTGLSPLVAFLQHREVQLRAMQAKSADDQDVEEDAESLYRWTGHAHLFFGCRNLNDYLYQQELENWRAAGVLTHLDVAFSRLGEDKIYVQHLIGRHSKDLWDVLSQPNCHYYVCGDAKMADEVFEELMNIAKTTGGLSHAEAVRFFQKMQDEHRLSMDVWGVLLNYQTAIAEVQEANYSRGERWLERVSAD